MKILKKQLNKCRKKGKKMCCNMLKYFCNVISRLQGALHACQYESNYVLY